jgi:two-component system nitrate/nitrite response regulator NarL
MNVIIISKYALIREGLYSIILRNNSIISFAGETLREAKGLIVENQIDIIFCDLNELNKTELLLIKELKEHKIKSKFIVIDFTKNKELFVEAIKFGVEGYILGTSNETEIIHIIDQVAKGRKYFDAYFIDSMINEDSVETEGIEQLTAREKEILCAIGKGMSNRKISEELYISEHTVKKHINHIFDKLNIRDRTQAALYANRYGIIKENAS